MEHADLQKPLFSRKDLLALSVPIVIESILSIITGMVDSIMVSSAGEAAVSGISLVNQINVLFAVIFSAIASGGVIITSQYLGSGNLAKAKTSANQLLYATTACALFLTLAIIGIIPQVLRLVYGQLDADVFESAKVYYFYLLLGMPCYAMASSCNALLRATSHSKLALMLSGGANLLNIIGNAVLIYGFKLGAAGAAISTTFCHIVWCIIAMFILHNQGLPVHFENLLKFRLDFDVMKRVMQVGCANGLESGLFQLGKLLVSSLISSFGTVIIAANAVANNILNIGWSIVGSLGTVLLTVVGRCIGADQPQQAKAYTKKFLMLGHVFTFVIFGSVFLLRTQLVQMFAFEQSSLDIAAYYTGVAALLTIVAFYGNTFLPVSAFRAAGDIRYAAILSISSMFLFRVGLSYLLNYLFDIGLMCVWLGMFADWAVRSFLNTLRFRSGKWLQKKLI